MGCTNGSSLPNSAKTSKNQKDIKKSQNTPSNKVIEVSFRCTYDIRYLSDVQIINNRDIDETDINEEIKSKIKILNGDKKEELIFKKTFNETGINTIDFIIEGKLNNMSYMFYNCSEIKEIEFISFDTSEVTKMKELFSGCKKLEYLDLTNFNISNVIDMESMFNECYKLKEIKGINNFNTSNVISMGNMFNICTELN